MLEHTFVRIPGIGKATEQGLWQKGVHTWADAECPITGHQVPRDARAVVRPILGGLHHEYGLERLAA